jgi:hypothetical protein
MILSWKYKVRQWKAIYNDKGDSSSRGCKNYKYMYSTTDTHIHLANIKGPEGRDRL